MFDGLVFDEFRSIGTSVGIEDEWFLKCVPCTHGGVSISPMADFIMNVILESNLFLIKHHAVKTYGGIEV
jgi:hypothetical protein